MNDNCTPAALKIIFIVSLILPYKYGALIFNKTHITLLTYLYSLLYSSLFITKFTLIFFPKTLSRNPRVRKNIYHNAVVSLAKCSTRNIGSVFKHKM